MMSIIIPSQYLGLLSLFITNYKVSTCLKDLAFVCNIITFYITKIKIYLLNNVMLINPPVYGILKSLSNRDTKKFFHLFIL